VETQAASACVIGCTNRCIASNASSHPRTFTAIPTVHELCQHTPNAVKPNIFIPTHSSETTDHRSINLGEIQVAHSQAKTPEEPEQ
jgi:hypothetical protein